MMKIASQALIASLIAASAVFAALPAAAQTSPAAPSPYQGWGLTIAHKTVGEKCANALSADDVAVLKTFIAKGLEHTKQNDSKFDADGFARTFEQEMIAKYQTPANCTKSAIDQAREAVVAARKILAGDTTAR